MVRRWCRGVVVCAVPSAALLAAGSLRAQERGQELGPILFSYQAQAGCPEALDFQRSVERRSSHIHFVDEGSHERELSIRLRRVGDFTVGELRLVEKNGSLRQRSVRFTTCAEAVEGLALITAVSLDPRAFAAEREPAPSTTTSSTPKPAPPPPAPVTKRPEIVPPPSKSGAVIEGALGAEFQSVFLVLPSAALGGSLFLDVASASPSWFAPLVRLAVTHVERQGIPETGFNANFALTLATLTACPMKLEADFLWLRPCLFGTGGALRSWGSNTPKPASATTQFWAAGGSLLLAARVGPAFELTADVGAGGTVFTHDEFVFEANPPFWTTRKPYLSTGLGFRFAFR